MNILIYLFIVYSFLGWVFETTIAAIKRKRFVNRGIINGPFCVIYGISAVAITVILRDLNGFWLLFGSMIVATLIEWTGGHIIEKMYHERWWDYSNFKFNFDGYICLGASVIWGVMGFVVKTWVNDLFINIYKLIPVYIMEIIVWILLAVIFIDGLATMLILSGHHKSEKYCKKAEDILDTVTKGLSDRIYGVIDSRLGKAYTRSKPEIGEQKDKTKFATGCSFYKVVMLFFIGAFLGDIVETVFCRIVMGSWMSRSSVIYGQFSIVWGLGVAAITVLLYKYKDKNILFLFFTGTILGGAYEYICSVFTEIAFGTVFWDYSDMPFNLGGRINLLYCSFWGIAAIVWFKVAYPLLSALIEKIPKKPGIIATWMLLAFMLVNVSISSIALARYQERSKGKNANNNIEKWIDTKYDDNLMNRVYPKALIVD